MLLLKGFEGWHQTLSKVWNCTVLDKVDIPNVANRSSNSSLHTDLISTAPS
jgi:hypothetical protein